MRATRTKRNLQDLRRYNQLTEKEGLNERYTKMFRTLHWKEQGYAFLGFKIQNSQHQQLSVVWRQAVYRREVSINCGSKHWWFWTPWEPIVCSLNTLHYNTTHRAYPDIFWWCAKLHSNLSKLLFLLNPSDHTFDIWMILFRFSKKITYFFYSENF